MPAPTSRSVAFRRWLAVLAWMTLIFIASSDAESGPRGSRLLAPLIRWFCPDISPGVLESIVLVARKGVHFVTFGVLAGLGFRAWAAQHPGEWRTSSAWRALVLTVLYAISDEIHQSFVPTRVGSPIDVLIDTSGVLATLWLIRRFGYPSLQRHGR